MKSALGFSATVDNANLERLRTTRDPQAVKKIRHESHEEANKLIQRLYPKTAVIGEILAFDNVLIVS